ncbi:MAG: hypothetical protein H7Y17_01075 [Chlorobia bacterium]|nr:hypothetical protein [Fimbriimonadaceae bacterium]
MLYLLAAACVLNQSPIQPDPLSRAFQRPPASARPHTWWHWMDGNITKEGITADLEAMKQAGIGGAHMFDVGQGVPAGRINYNTPEWRALMVHAIREAKRLGLEMTMHNCAGWSSSGGPWVKPADAMKKVVNASLEFEGPGNPPLPTPSKVGGFYQDISLCAFPASGQPGTMSRNELTGLGANPGAVSRLDWPTVNPSKAILIPLNRIGSNGDIGFQLPEGKWTILRLGATLTGSQNVASRDSGRGLEVDKLSATSLDNFLDGGLNPLLDQVGQSSALTTVLVDSYETGYNNWTPGLLDEFRARRGYHARPYLPTLAGYLIKDEQTTLGFLFDYRRTIAELWAKNYSGHFASRLRERNLDLAIEPYGNGNFDPFTFAKPAGLIMGEYWVGDSQINPSVKHASSVAHVYGHSVVGAEALTATPDQAGWRNQPRQWKPFADHAMTLGINRIIYHRFAHQPWVSGVLPGMTMGPWGSHVDRGNTIWPYMSTWNEYLSRCQFMLQSGKFVGDVLLFSGEDSPQSYSGEGQDLPQIPPGYDYDFCGLDPLMSLTVKNRRLVLPNGASYAVLALPNTELMTLPLVRKIKQLVEAGATVVGPKPIRTPSLREATPDGNAELMMLADLVWGRTTLGPGSNQHGKGKVSWGRTVLEVLAEAKVVPDFTTEAKGVRAIHRRIGDIESYFVASSQPYPRTVTCRFRINGKANRVQFWHPETGQIEEAPVWKLVPNGGIEVPIHLDADDSVFVMISPKAQASAHVIDVKATLATERAKPLPVLRIIKAVYGDAASGKVKDVTQIVASAAGPNSLRINASNNELGGDPAVNIVKNLVLTYSLGGDAKTITARENATIAIGNLPDAGSPPPYQLHSGELRVWQKGDYSLTWSDQRQTKLAVQDLPNPITATGPWLAKFPSGWDAPPIVTFNKLASWTEHSNFGVKHFSGTVRYTHVLQVPQNLLGKGKRLMLDLGDVRELCRVRLNGRTLATLWKPPFRIDITDVAKTGKNALEVDVTNLWVNRLVGDEQFPDDMGWNGAQLKAWPKWFTDHQPRPEPRRKTFTTWRHNFKDTPLLPSGLLGPVVLRPVRTVPLRP